MIASQPTCQRCGMQCRRSVLRVDLHFGICQCGVIFTDDPLAEIDRFVAGQARALTMAWADRPPFGEVPWPWTSTRPRVGPPR